MPTSNRWKYERGKGTIDLSSDTFKMLIMKSGFTFSPISHGTYADVSGEEISGEYGYTTGGITLTVDEAWQQDNLNNQAMVIFENMTLTADGGTLETAQGALMMDDTHTDKIIVGPFEFSGEVTLYDTQSIVIPRPGIRTVSVGD